MDETVTHWFQGFEKGIARLEPSQRACFFQECGKNCVQQFTLPFYKRIWEEADGQMDLFFEKLNGIPGVRSEIRKPGQVYGLYFEHCSCKLYTEGYVQTPLLCECSRQSILFVMNTLWKNRAYNVEICSTILRGSKACNFIITVQEP